MSLKRFAALSCAASSVALLACTTPQPARAQQSQVVTTCGAQSLPTTGTSGTYIDATGNLCTNASGGGGGGNVNLTGINGVAPAVGNGATNTGTQRVTLSNDSTGQVTAIGPTANGGTPATPPVLIGGTADGSGTGAVGNAKIDSSGNFYGVVTVPSGSDVVEGASNDVAGCASGSAKTIAGCMAQLHSDISGPIPAGTNSIGTLNGATPYGFTSAASTNATSVKGSAGVLTAINPTNTTTTTYYLRLYNLASAPTCSSATGFVASIPIPPSAAAGGVGGIAANLGSGGLTFSTGIAFCLTGGGSSTDNTNAATGLYILAGYR